MRASEDEQHRDGVPKVATGSFDLASFPMFRAAKVSHDHHGCRLIEADLLVR